jgi:ElaB/YqjD/DUF883 family membrane-anchored ribosome-binding protein
LPYPIKISIFAYVNQLKTKIMGFIDSVKKLFGTTKEVSAVKADEIKGKASHGVETAKEYAKEAGVKIDEVAQDVKNKAKEAGEKVKDMGDTMKEKAEDLIEKLDEKAAVVVDKIEEKMRATLEPKTETPETPVTPAAPEKPEEPKA